MVRQLLQFLRGRGNQRAVNPKEDPEEGTRYLAQGTPNPLVSRSLTRQNPCPVFVRCPLAQSPANQQSTLRLQPGILAQLSFQTGTKRRVEVVRGSRLRREIYSSSSSPLSKPYTAPIPTDLPFPDFFQPAVSVGNVGQLAVDLVISTLGMSKVGYFYTDCLVPMIGNNPYATTGDNTAELCINAEVYALPSKQLVVLQIRSPFIKNKYRPFCQTLLSWVESCRFAKVVLLSSSHAYQRSDQQLFGTPLRYLLSPAVQKTDEELMQKLNWRELEKIAAFPGVNGDEKVLYIPGSGITKLLFTESCSKGIQMIVLLKFCSEGDNIPDALALTDYLNEWLQLTGNQSSSSPTKSSRWKIPSSWKLIFGSGLPPALF
ncbi:proteasome assembly chaperone 2 isoform X2 [Hemicordylus capensis]|uniref:proteasome assembly chaperone 2 isoform X2 n=1 Tax=Hemicordylus capensis TaxID=884348 RepID=UPI002303C24B|nr:proteasome assembly chaperone 2 isoform X2 [Hemicordylus capensis]